MADIYWLPNVKDAEAPTLAEIQDGAHIETEITLPLTDGNWGKEVITVYTNYRWGTPIKFPTTPETVCFMTGLER